MKKILSLILVLAMTFSLSTTALAADSTTYIGSLGHTLFEICRVIP